jgi:hypothetical protein
MPCALEKGRAHGNVVQMLKEMGMALENWSYRQQKMLVRAKKCSFVSKNECLNAHVLENHKMIVYCIF